MKDMPMVSVEEAQQIVLEAVAPLDIEEVPVVESLGRVIARDVTSDIDISPFDHAAMDGFACKASQLENASSEAPVRLKVVAEVPAGSVYNGEIADDECVRIMTGAPTPACTDTVIKYEIVDYLGTDGRVGTTVAFDQPSKVGSNIRHAGEEVAAGSVAIAKGEVVTAAGVGFLASCGATTVPVYRRPKVAILSLGSELVSPTVVPGPGQIRESNSYALAACAVQAGAIPTQFPAVPDDREAIQAVVREAVRDYDFVVTSGGASNGDYDFIKDTIDELGEVRMTLVNMRPGKAQTFGVIDGTPILGLAGNPAAAYCGFEMLIRPALRCMQGHSAQTRPQVVATLTDFAKKRDSRRILLRSTLSRAEDGSLLVTPAKNQSSGLFSTLHRANCLAVLPEGVPESKRIEAGTRVTCLLLDVEEGTVF